MSQMNADLLYLREQLLAKKTSETPTLNTEVQDLLTRIASLEEDKAKLQEMLESAREEGTNLRRDLQESKEAVSKCAGIRIWFSLESTTCLRLFL